MKPDFDYQSVPYDFVHCLNERCERAGQCLRRQVALHLTSDRKFVQIVNPLNMGSAGGNCPHFKEDRLLRYAQGMVHLYDKLTCLEAADVKSAVYGYLGRNMYYRSRNGGRLITPEEQSFIRKAFQRAGIQAEPVFDSYREEYDWE